MVTEIKIINDREKESPTLRLGIWYSAKHKKFPGIFLITPYDDTFEKILTIYDSAFEIVGTDWVKRYLHSIKEVEKLEIRIT